jgi:hypothetical protein
VQFVDPLSIKDQLRFWMIKMTGSAENSSIDSTCAYESSSDEEFGQWLSTNVSDESCSDKTSGEECNDEDEEDLQFEEGISTSSRESEEYIRRGR